MRVATDSSLYEIAGMSAEQELLDIADAMKEVEGRFQESRQLGMYLQSEDEATFKRLAVEAKSILDAELGHLNDFSMNLIHAINSGSGGFLGGPSKAAVQEARMLVVGGVNHMRRRLPSTGMQAPTASRPLYVDSSRLAALARSSDATFDTSRLIRLGEEINIAAEYECHMATAMLLRAVVDHVPPIFGFRTFSEVANNYGGGRSFQELMQHLDRSLRKIADSHLHVPIRSSEVLPTAPQVDFRAGLDALLGEIIRVLK